MYTSHYCFVLLPRGWQVIYQQNQVNEIHHDSHSGGLRPRWSVPIPPMIVLESLFSFFLVSLQRDCGCDATTSHWTAAETEWLSLTMALIRINPQTGNTIEGPLQHWARQSVVSERSEKLRSKKKRYWGEKKMAVKRHLVWAKATFKNSFAAQFFFFFYFYSTTSH